MNEELRQALMDYLGARYEEGPDGVLLSPASERELLGTLRLLRERGGEVHRGVTISRRRFDAIGEVEDKSAILHVGAGARLSAVEAVADKAGLTLGPLPPGALELDVAGFVEGPYEGLRSVPGGRLEPVPLALTVVMPQGLIYASHPSPRRATGPDLSALFLGAEGRAGLVLAATLRLFPRPVTRRWAALSFPSAKALVDTLLRALADGCRLDHASARRRGDRFLLEVCVPGSPEGAERDVASLTLRGAQAGGRIERRDGEGRGEAREAPGPTPEREASWDAVEQGLVAGAGAGLVLYRLAVDSAVVIGEVEGVALSAAAAGAPAQPWLEIVSAVDPEGLMGGAA